MDALLATQIKCADVFLMWQGMMADFGMDGMSTRANFQQENIREVLMKLAPIWADCPQQLQAVVDTVQILTVLLGMTFKSQMDGGEPTTEEKKEFLLSTWVEASDVFQLPQPTLPASMRTKLANYVTCDDLKQLLLKELKQARIETNTMKGQCDPIPEIAHIGARFHYVDALLDDVQTVVRSM